MQKTPLEEKLVDKFEAGDKEKFVQDASGWLDQNHSAENFEFEAKQKKLQVVGRVSGVVTETTCRGEAHG